MPAEACPQGVSWHKDAVERNNSCIYPLSLPEFVVLVNGLVLGLLVEELELGAAQGVQKANEVIVLHVGAFLGTKAK